MLLVVVVAVLSVVAVSDATHNIPMYSCVSFTMNQNRTLSRATKSVVPLRNDLASLVSSSFRVAPCLWHCDPDSVSIISAHTDGYYLTAGSDSLSFTDPNNILPTSMSPIFRIQSTTGNLVTIAVVGGPQDGKLVALSAGSVVLQQSTTAEITPHQQLQWSGCLLFPQDNTCILPANNRGCSACPEPMTNQGGICRIDNIESIITTLTRAQHQELTLDNELVAAAVSDVVRVCAVMTWPWHLHAFDADQDQSDAVSDLVSQMDPDEVADYETLRDTACTLAQTQQSGGATLIPQEKSVFHPIAVPDLIQTIKTQLEMLRVLDSSLCEWQKEQNLEARAAVLWSSYNTRTAQFINHVDSTLAEQKAILNAYKVAVDMVSGNLSLATSRIGPLVDDAVQSLEDEMNRLQAFEDKIFAAGYSFIRYGQKMVQYAQIAVALYTASQQTNKGATTPEGGGTSPLPSINIFGNKQNEINFVADDTFSGLDWSDSSLDDSEREFLVRNNKGDDDDDDAATTAAKDKEKNMKRARQAKELLEKAEDYVRKYFGLIDDYDYSGGPQTYGNITIGSLCNETDCHQVEELMIHTYKQMEYVSSLSSLVTVFEEAANTTVDTPEQFIQAMPQLSLDTLTSTNVDRCLSAMRLKLHKPTQPSITVLDRDINLVVSLIRARVSAMRGWFDAACAVSELKAIKNLLQVQHEKMSQQVEGRVTGFTVAALGASVIASRRHALVAVIQRNLFSMLAQLNYYSSTDVSFLSFGDGTVVGEGSPLTSPLFPPTAMLAHRFKEYSAAFLSKPSKVRSSTCWASIEVWDNSTSRAKFDAFRQGKAPLPVSLTPAFELKVDVSGEDISPLVDADGNVISNPSPSPKALAAAPFWGSKVLSARAYLLFDKGAETIQSLATTTGEVFLGVTHSGQSLTVLDTEADHSLFFHNSVTFPYLYHGENLCPLSEASGSQTSSVVQPSPFGVWQIALISGVSQEARKTIRGVRLELEVSSFVDAENGQSPPLIYGAHNMCDVPIAIQQIMANDQAADSGDFAGKMPLALVILVVSGGLLLVSLVGFVVIYKRSRMKEKAEFHDMYVAMKARPSQAVESGLVMPRPRSVE